MNENQVKQIDGSILEGGGQILRNSLALAALLRRPIVIKNIRGKRPKPGLRKQHQVGIQVINACCDGQVEGNQVESCQITLKPKTLVPLDIQVDMETAGSCTLVTQAALPCLLFTGGDSKLEVNGGTDADFAPPIDYLRFVFLPICQRFLLGDRISIQLLKRGFFPKGGGKIVLGVKSFEPGQSIPAFQIPERGKVIKFEARIFSTKQVKEARIEAVKNIVENRLKTSSEYGDVPIHFTCSKEEKSFGYGFGILILAFTENGSILSGSHRASRKVSDDAMANGSVDMLIRNLKTHGGVDEYMQDQLIIFMALASGTSSITTGALSLHSETAIWIASELTGAKFAIEKKSEDLIVITCQGVGFKQLKRSRKTSS